MLYYDGSAVGTSVSILSSNVIGDLLFNQVH
jgi:hypothetical protein